MAKKRLTDRTLKALKPAPSGQRYEVMDADVRGLGIRVTDKGQRSFILIARYPGSDNPARRTLGDYPTLTLEKARTKARHWRELIGQGIDPKVEEESLRRAELRKQADSFDAVVEEFAKRKLKDQRRGEIVKRELQKFGERWEGRPITSIGRRDVIDAVKEVLDRGATYQAHNLLGHVRALFNWAIEAEDYGLETSPCDRIRPKTLIGERKPRQRVLEDAELKALWQATGGMNYPFGPPFRLLLLTGARKSEIAQAHWSEINGNLLTVPPERFKSDATHIIPLTREATAILELLPRFAKGDYIFSTSYGAKPVKGFSKAKERLDELMGTPKSFVIHDLRRTVRTRLASLQVPDTIAEMVIGHGKKGIQRVYDQHTYEAEMRKALELWASKLRSIVEPPPENVVKLKTRG